MGTQIGALHVRRSIYIKAVPSTVWKEFTSYERINAWLGIGQTLLEYESHVEAAIRFSVDIDGQQAFFGGKILRVSENEELSFESQWESSDDWSVPTIWTIRLTPLYEGTLTELFHHGFERLGKDAADNLEGYEEGWTVKHLKKLRKIVENPDA